MAMNICQRVTRLEENIERISEVLDGFIENANYNSCKLYKLVYKVYKAYKTGLKPLI